MYDLAINHIPLKIPLGTLCTLTFSLSGLHLLGLLQIEVGTFEPRLLLLMALYTAVLTAIIWIHMQIIIKVRVNLSSSQQMSTEQYQKRKLQETELRLKQLYRDEKYKQWERESKERQQNKGNIIYQIVDSDSDQEDNIITEHSLATTKKLF